MPILYPKDFVLGKKAPCSRSLDKPLHSYPIIYSVFLSSKKKKKKIPRKQLKSYVSRATIFSCSAFNSTFITNALIFYLHQNSFTRLEISDLSTYSFFISNMTVWF